MKKSLIILIIAASMLLTSCETTHQPHNYASTYLVGNFTVIEECNDIGNFYSIVKHDETGVLYIILGSGNTSTMSPILKADGTPYTIEDVNIKNYE